MWWKSRGRTGRSETAKRNIPYKELICCRSVGHHGSWLRAPHRNEFLSFAPARIMTKNHNVEDPLVALFLRFNQAESLHVEQVLLHPVNLLPGHSPALQIHCEAREMRRSGIAIRGCGVAIVPSQFFLNLYRTHRRVHLNLLVKAMVIRLRKILHEVARPRAAVPPRRIEPRIKAQRVARKNRL